MQNVISRGKVDKFLDSLGGRIVSVEFIKVDGSKRKMTGRVGVKTGTSGNHNAAFDSDKPYISFYEMFSSDGKPGSVVGYRCVNLDTISSIKANGQQYIVQ
jgi:hypothetical protein